MTDPVVLGPVVKVISGDQSYTVRMGPTSPTAEDYARLAQTDRHATAIESLDGKTTYWRAPARDDPK